MHFRTANLKSFTHTQPNIAGFFMDIGSWAQQQRDMVAMGNCTAGLNVNCLRGETADPARCIFAPVTAKYCQTPMLALQSQYDAYQLGSILQSQDPAKVNPFGRNLTATLQAQLLDGNRPNAAFVNSADIHCGFWGDCLGQG